MKNPSWKTSIFPKEMTEMTKYFLMWGPPLRQLRLLVYKAHPWRIHGAGIYVYMLTWLGYIDGIHVTIYSSTMDPMGHEYLLVDKPHEY